MANQITVTSGTGNIQVTTSRTVIGTVANVASANYANFAGQVVDANQPNITGLGTLTGLVVGGNITPNANVTYNLGNNTNRFNDLYLSNSTIYLGAQEISANATSTIFNGNVAAQEFIGNGNFGNVTTTGTITTQDLIVQGNLQIGNLVANSANYANFAGTANIANTVAGANVTGTVANATYATSAGTANSATVAASANSVAGANVTGTVANATYAISAGSANVAATANSVAVANVSGIGNIATINLDGNVSNVLRGDGTFAAEAGNLNANYANFAGTAFNVSGSNVSGSVANATYANTAGIAYNVSGSNVSGAVANATYANSANTANSATVAASANSVSGANVVGAVANATYADSANTANSATVAASANSVAVANVSGIGNIAITNYDGNGSNILHGNGYWGPEIGPQSVANANYANFAGTAYSVSGSNVSGEVANANYATYSGTAYSVSGSNVSGTVANANYASYSNVANSANSVAGANVTGTVANANFASFSNVANSANTVAGANVTGTVANANIANNITILQDFGNANSQYITYVGANTSGDQKVKVDLSLAYIPNTNILSTNSNGGFHGKLVGANTSNPTSFVKVASATGNITANIAGTTRLTVSANGIDVNGNITSTNADLGNSVVANYFTGNLYGNANTAGTVTVAAQPNITSVGNLTGLTVNGNLNVANTLLLSNTVQVTSPGYYLPYGFYYSGGMPNNNVIFTVAVNGDVTNGSNVMNNVTLSTVNTGTSLSLANYASYLSNLSLIPTLNFDTGYINTNIPLLGTISNVDVANSTITYSNNFTGTNNITVQTAVTLYDTSKNAYFGSTRFVLGQAFNTYASNNEIVMDTVDPIDFDIGPGAPIQFIGTTFGGITANTTYYVDTVVSGNTAITISDTEFGPTKTLSNGSGTMMVIHASTDIAQTASLSGKTIRPNYNTFFAGPFSALPTYANLSTTTNPNFATTPTIGWRYSKSLNINNNTPTEAPGGFIANIQYNQLVGPTVVGTLAAPTITGEIYDQFGINGITAVNSGNDANLTGLRTAFSTLSYTDGGSDSASVTNPGNPPGFQMTTYTGNATADINERYLRTGRTIGRIAWYGAQKVNGAYYVPPGSSPQAGIYVQALGNWDGSVNTSLPMVFALQYSPLNAAGSTPNYTRINRTFLQAANNTTTLGGATNIQFKPLARSSNATNNRSPSALGNVSINPQTWVDISGYTQGNAVSNGAGALLNVTTTDTNQNGNVALRLSRTVGNTANMEFRLPTASANTMVLVDNASGNTLATFTDGYANFTGQLNSLRTYASFYNPNDIAITANTVANLDLTNTYSANGVSIVSNNQITIARAGTYNIQMSLQLTNSDNASEHDFDVWLAKNGNDIANTATQYTVIKNNGKNVVALNFVDTCNANDYYQIRYASQSANISLEAFASQSTPYVRPAIPSAIVTVVPVGA
jgi:hypothetical protein